MTSITEKLGKTRPADLTDSEDDSTNLREIFEQLKEVYFQFEPAILLFLQPLFYELSFIVSYYIINLSFPDGDKNFSRTVEAAHKTVDQYQLYPVSWFLAALVFAYLYYHHKSNDHRPVFPADLEVREDMTKEQRIFIKFLNRD